MAKVNTTRNGTNRNHVSPDIMSWRSNDEATSNIRHSTRELACVPHKMSRSWKTKQDWGTLPVQNPETWELNAKQISNWIKTRKRTFSFCCKRCWWDSMQNLEKVYGLDSTTASMLISWFWSLYCGYKRQSPVFRKLT